MPGYRSPAKSIEPSLMAVLGVWTSRLNSGSLLGSIISRGCTQRTPKTAKEPRSGLRLVNPAGVLRAVQRLTRPGHPAESPAWRPSATGPRQPITPWERGALPDCGASAPRAGLTDRSRMMTRTGEPALRDLLA